MLRNQGRIHNAHSTLGGYLDRERIKGRLPETNWTTGPL